MLKYTPVGHPDRFPLQMALTRLEFVASTLNERKRAIESHLGVRELEKRMINLEESIQAPGREFVQLDFVQQQVLLPYLFSCLSAYLIIYLFVGLFICLFVYVFIYFWLLSYLVILSKSLQLDKHRLFQWISKLYPYDALMLP
jgi:hypothetical protein